MDRPDDPRGTGAELFADDAWSEQTWWAELAGRPRRDYVVADADGTVVGYAGLDVAGDVADVMTVATAPTHQRKGIGRLLLDDLVRRAVEHGCEALLLEVRADNDAARISMSATVLRSSPCAAATTSPATSTRSSCAGC